MQNFKMNRLFSALVCCAIAIAMSPQLNAQSQPVLEWKLEKGQAFEVTTEQVVETLAKVSGQEIGSTVVSETWTDWTVKDKANGIAEVASTITRMKMKTESMAGEMKVDTKGEVASGPGADNALDMVLPMIDQAIIMKVLPTGKMKDLEMPESFGDSVDSMMGAQAQQMMKSTLENSLLEFPEKALSVGDSWDKTIKTPSPAGDMTIETTYTYAGTAEVDGNSLHKIDVDIKMDFGADNITIDSQDTTGSIYFDGDEGRMYSSIVKQEVEMTISAGGQTVKQTLDQTAKAKFTPKK